MKWVKHGLVYAPQGDLWWARTHAYLPTAEVVDDAFIRVYVTSYDEQKYGRIGFLDLDIENPRAILRLTTEPVLDLGVPGTFDDSGVTPSCLVQRGDQKWLYYVGWQRAEQVPYLNFTGLAVSESGGETFRRHALTPVLDRSTKEPFLRSAITILVEQGTYRAWYVSGLRWIAVQGKPYPTYVIRHAESADGVNWSRENPICIDFEDEDEFGFGRPWVLKDGPTYKMWYSIRSTRRPYCIGYAESSDGRSWVRKDEEVGIAAASSGWDAEMICFPCVVDVRGRRYMFYNGNRYGETGFGYAELEED